MKGSGGEIAFNFRYLLEMLSSIEGEDVNFEMIESLNPGRFTEADGNDNFFHIIMPVRLQS
jgi:DNA polymerase III subunit beta